MQEKFWKGLSEWFSNRGVRVQRVIDNAIDELRQELYETYGIEEKVSE